MKDIIKGGVAVCSPCDMSTLLIKHFSNWLIFPSGPKSVLCTGLSLPFSSPSKLKTL